MKKLRLLWSLPLIAALIFTFGFEYQGYSQTASTVVEQAPKLKGNVIDGKSGAPLEKAIVMIVHSKEKGVQKMNGRTYEKRSGGYTNAEGNYLLQLEKSDSLIVFRKEGYESITVPYKGQDIVNVVLSPKPIVDNRDNN